jgi:hypothetical protein
MDTIENTLKQLFKVVMPDGKLPLPLTDERITTVQVCDGTPGLIPMYLVASEMFPSLRPHIFKLLKQAAKVTWQEGLLRKSTALSHGIAGNACLMHTMYRTFKQLEQVAITPKNTELYKRLASQWRTRTYCFVQALCDKVPRKQPKKFKSEEKDKSVSHPFGLMEGIAGEICILSDFLRDENLIRFPGYEI